jgi:hydrogenase maturation protease
MNSAGREKIRVLIMGVGNTLLQDDGVGIHVAESLRPWAEKHHGVRILDGGTLGLSLLPEIEAATALIVVDAGDFGASPGEIRVFENEDMDRQLAGKKTTVHEVAVADLLAAASMSGTRPRDRALVAIQPASVDWGLAPTEAVQQAIPRARELIGTLAESWAA